MLIGPSGCGKTTTLQMINRLVEPTDGQILVNGRPNTEMDVVQLRREMGYVFQEIGLFPHMTVAQNISVVPDLQGWSAQQKQQRAEELLELVRMDSDIYIDRFPRELSGGQQQRIGVLRALAADPDILLMDEPFGALDPITRSQLQQELLELQQEVQKTIVFVTHDMDEATKLADRIVMMKNGHIVQIDPPRDMLRNPEDRFVAEFIGPRRMLQDPLDVTVRELASNGAVRASSDLRLSEAMKKMRQEESDYLVLLDGKNRFAGLVSADDVSRAANDADKKTSVTELADRQTVSCDESVFQAVHKLARSSSAGLGVVDEQNRLVGVFTKTGFVDILVEEMWPREAIDLPEED